MLQRWTSGTYSSAKYIMLNQQFQIRPPTWRRSAMLWCAVDRAVVRPFASSNVFILVGHAEK